jgi:RNA polymerase sigma-70 factor (ECF subfamily)
VTAALATRVGARSAGPLPRAGEDGDLSSPSSLEAAMERFADGDDAAFGLVYRLAAPRLRCLFSRLGNAPSLVDDLVQETLLRMYRARASYWRGAKVLPWAHTIARRLMIDRARQRRLQRATDDAYADYQLAGYEPPRADEELAARRMASAVADVLDRLPPGQALAFRLTREEGRSPSEAAESLGLTNLAVRLRTHRACNTIREALRDHV